MNLRIAVLPCLLLAACATRSASIDQRMILPDSGDRYAMEDRQLFLMPMSLGNEPPEFPAALRLNDLAPTTVCAEITISDAGRVEHVAPVRETGDCGTGVAEQSRVCNRPSNPGYGNGVSSRRPSARSATRRRRAMQTASARMATPNAGRSRCGWHMRSPSRCATASGGYPAIASTGGDADRLS